MTPKKQSPSFLGTTWSALMGIVTTPALTSEAHNESAAAAKAAGFILTDRIAPLVGIEIYYGASGALLEPREME